MARTMPPTRNTTGATVVAYAGLAPIDAYDELIDRPLGYFESTAAAQTSITAITNFYAKQTIVAGLTHSIGGAAGHFQTNCSGAMVGKIGGLGSWVTLEDGMTGYAGGLDVAAVITPLNVGVRVATGSTVTLTSSQLVFGLHAQCTLQGTGVPVYDTNHTNIFFARVNVYGATLCSLFYFESSISAGMVAAGTYTTEACQFPLAWIHGAGPTLDHPLYVKLYVT
jgi:hypothetical protein